MIQAMLKALGGVLLLVFLVSEVWAGKDCEVIIQTQVRATASEVWRNIVPLRSTRADVERLLGPLKSSIGNIYLYDSVNDKIEVSYSGDPCKPDNTKVTGTPSDVVSRIMISPKRTLLISNMRLEKRKYKRVPLDHPENLVHYLNSEEGTTIEAVLFEGCEEVVSIIYRGTKQDREVRCGPNLQSVNKKP